MNYDTVTKPTECRMVVATADVAFFCKACEGKPDVETFSMLDKFYGVVDALVTEAGGRVLKFMGDLALVVYPEANARQAVSSLEKLREQAQGLWREFEAKCVVRTKAHVGSVVCGPIGPEKRFDAIGNTLNELFRMPGDGPDLSESLQALVK